MLIGVSAEDVTESKGFSQCLDVCARDLAIDQACDIRLAVTDSIFDGPLLAPAGISSHSKCRAFYRIRGTINKWNLAMPLLQRTPIIEANIK